VQQPVDYPSKQTTGCCRCLDCAMVARSGHFRQNANGIVPRASNQEARCRLGPSIRSGPEKIFRRPPPATSAPRVTKRSRSGAPDTASRSAGNLGNGAEALEGRNGLTSMIGDVLRRAPDTTRSERLIGDYKSVRSCPRAGRRRQLHAPRRQRLRRAGRAAVRRRVRGTPTTASLVAGGSARRRRDGSRTGQE